jgi:hypothetical protein
VAVPARQSRVARELYCWSPISSSVLLDDSADTFGLSIAAAFQDPGVSLPSNLGIQRYLVGDRSSSRLLFLPHTSPVELADRFTERCSERLNPQSIFSSDSSCAFYDHAHSVGLDNGDWCLRDDEFAFGDNIDNVIGETRFAARAQNGDCGALHSGRERERSRELSRHAGKRWAGRI